MELDGYNSKLGLAFEYQGKQHYQFIKFFHNSYRGFIRQKYVDYIKVLRCKQYGVKLISVPYWENNNQTINRIGVKFA